MSVDFTTAQICGRLTDDPETSDGPGGMKITKFTVASNHRIGKQERTSFIPITVFGKEAELCAQYLSKGRVAFVLVGRIDTDSYTDRNGVKRKGFSFIANNVIFGPGGTKSDTEEKEEIDLSSLDPKTHAKVVSMLKQAKGQAEA